MCIEYDRRTIRQVRASLTRKRERRRWPEMPVMSVGELLHSDVTVEYRQPNHVRQNAPCFPAAPFQIDPGGRTVLAFGNRIVDGGADAKDGVDLGVQARALP